MTNNNTTTATFSAIYATLQSWAGSIDEHGLADGTATVTEEYIEYPADSPMGDWHAVSVCGLHSGVPVSCSGL